MSSLSAADVPLEALDLGLRRHRLPTPEPTRVAQSDSLFRHGQLAALVVCAGTDRPALIDGFKRVDAAFDLGLDRLRAVELTEGVALVAMYSLNRSASIPAGSAGGWRSLGVSRSLCKTAFGWAC